MTLFTDSQGQFSLLRPTTWAAIPLGESARSIGVLASFYDTADASSTLAGKQPPSLSLPLTLYTLSSFPLMVPVRCSTAIRPGAYFIQDFPRGFSALTAPPTTDRATLAVFVSPAPGGASSIEAVGDIGHWAQRVAGAPVIRLRPSPCCWATTIHSRSAASADGDACRGVGVASCDRAAPHAHAWLQVQRRSSRTQPCASGATGMGACTMS